MLYTAVQFCLYCELRRGPEIGTSGLWFPFMLRREADEASAVNFGTRPEKIDHLFLCFIYV